MVKVQCCICGHDFEKTVSEFNRANREGWRHCCGRSCVGRSVDSKIRSANSGHLPHDNRKDDLTPFRWFIHTSRTKRNNKQRKESNITAAYLKELWDEQKGVCPYTGWQLILPITSSRGWKSKQEKYKRASLDRIDPSKGYVEGNVRFISLS